MKINRTYFYLDPHQNQGFQYLLLLRLLRNRHHLPHPEKNHFKNSSFSWSLSRPQCYLCSNKQDCKSHLLHCHYHHLLPHPLHRLLHLQNHHHHYRLHSLPDKDQFSNKFYKKNDKMVKLKPVLKKDIISLDEVHHHSQRL